MIFKMIAKGLALPLFLILSSFVFHFGVKDSGMKEDYLIAGILLIIVLGVF